MNTTFRLLIILLLATCSLDASAQYTGFSRSEISALKKLIRKEPEAKKEYERLKAVAVSSLNDAPNPADTIFSEGILAGNPKKVKTGISLKDIPKTYALALVYRLEGGKEFRSKATEYLLAWASVNKPQGNPINDTKLDGMLQAFDLLKSTLQPEAAAQITQWLHVLADKELKRKPVTNNWNSHRLKTLGMVAWSVGDTALQRYVKTELEKHIARNLNADGSGFDFYERDALHYHVYTLEPLLKLAVLVSRAGGGDYYRFVSTSGSSIAKSVSFLAPFVSGEKSHPEFVNSKVKFDRDRANNNEPGYKAGSLFSPEHGATVISLASYFDPALPQQFNNLKIPGYWKSVLNPGY